MAQNDFNHYAKKHGPDAVADEKIADALQQRAAQGTLSCAVAFEVAENLHKTPAVIGRTADILELRLVKCQLGLFGHGPKKAPATPLESVSSQIQESIRNELEGGRLPCKNAWKIAKAFGTHKMKIAAACDAMGIKIGPCQLGAF